MAENKFARFRKGNKFAKFVSPETSEVAPTRKRAAPTLPLFVQPGVPSEFDRSQVESGADFDPLDFAKAVPGGVKRTLSGLTQRILEGRIGPGSMVDIPFTDIPADPLAAAIKFTPERFNPLKGISRNIGLRAQAEQERFEQENPTTNALGLPTTPQQFGRLTGEIAPLFLTPAAGTRSLLLGGATEGAKFGATRPTVEDDELISNVRTGGVAGAIGGTVLRGAIKVPGAVKATGKFIASPKKTISKVIERSVAAKVKREIRPEIFKTPAAKKGVRIEKQLGVKFRISQKTGGLKAQAIETEAFSRQPDLAIKDIEITNKAFLKKVTEITKKIDPDGHTTPEAAFRIRRVFKSAKQSFEAKRRAVFNAGLNAAEKVSGNKKVVDMRPFKKQMAKEINKMGRGSRQSREQASELVDEFKILPDRLTIREAQTFLRDYTDRAFGTGRLFSDSATAADRFTGRLLKDGLDKAITETPGKAGKILQITRNRYASISDGIRKLGNTTVGRMLNIKGGVSNEKVLNSFFRMSPSEIRSVTPILDVFDPKALQGARGLYIRSMIRASKASEKTLPGKTFVDMNKFAEKFNKDEKFLSMFPKDTKSGVEIRAQLLVIRKALRRLASEPLPKPGQGFISEVGEAGRLAGSLDVAQILGGGVPFGIRIFGIGKLFKDVTEKALLELMFTNAGRSSLEQVLKPIVSKTFNKQAAIASAALITKIIEGDN